MAVMVDATPRGATARVETPRKFGKQYGLPALPTTWNFQILVHYPYRRSHGIKAQTERVIGWRHRKYTTGPRIGE